ncbi:MAG TPA: hypothetical protein PKY96_07325 [Flavobacteriales bacterium]|nr:hypothetical protein [Flavobacteriales bacterium]
MMEYLSSRVSVERGDGRWSVVISARPTKSKRIMLLIWAAAWLLCGVLIIAERNQVPEGDPLRQYLLAFLAFWLYFMLKVGKGVLWRLKGFELWRVKDGQLTIKDSIFGYGRARSFFAENIEQLGLLAIDRSSWKWQWNESVWNVGGERLGFAHQGTKVAFGKSLTDDEAKRLVPMLKDALRKSSKTGQ